MYTGLTWLVSVVDQKSTSSCYKKGHIDWWPPTSTSTPEFPHQGSAKGSFFILQSLASSALQQVQAPQTGLHLSQEQKASATRTSRSACLVTFMDVLRALSQLYTMYVQRTTLDSNYRKWETPTRSVHKDIMAPKTHAFTTESETHFGSGAPVVAVFTCKVVVSIHIVNFIPLSWSQTYASGHNIPVCTVRDW